MSDKTHQQSSAAQGNDTLRQRLRTGLMRPDRLPSIGKELAYAVADIRQKLIEEAAYGRTVTPESIHGRPPEADADPLGRSQAADPLRERCRHAYDTRQQNAPDRGGHEPDR